MTRKNTLGRTVCFGILATAAATMLMANTVAFAAGLGEESEETVREDDHISGKVTEISSDSITISVLGGRPESGFEKGMPDGERPEFSEDERPEPPEGGQHDGQNPPELPDSQTPLERPEGGQHDGQNPPELPDGQTPPERPEGGQHDGQNPPELPDGQTPPERPEGGQHDGQNPPELPDGQTPLERPEGTVDHFMNGEFGSEVTVNIDSNTVITKGSDAESAALSDIAVGSMVVISLDGDTATSIMIMELPA